MLAGSAPKYLEIAEELRRRIAAGDLSAGAPLATERELSAHFKVSRICLRQAIACLIDEGCLARNAAGRVTVADSPAPRAQRSAAVRNIALVTTLPFSRVVERESSELGNAIAAVVECIEREHFSFTYLHIGCGRDLSRIDEEIARIAFYGGIYLPGGGVPDARVVAAMSADGTPLVLINAGDAGPETPAHTVDIDNAHGGYAATCHLLASGRRVLMANFSDGVPWQEQRLQGYYRALLEADRFASAEVISCGRMFGYDSRPPLEAGLAATLEQRLCGEPLALFAVSDPLALQIYDWAISAGLRVPEDLLIMGFGDIAPAAARGLSTVSHMSAAIGGEAGRILFAALGDGTPRRHRRLLRPELVLRASTGDATK